MKRIGFLIAGAVFLVAPTASFAGSISPSSFGATIAVGETVEVDKTVTTDETGVGVVDFYFLADNTGSMGGVIGSVQSVANSLLTALDAAFADAAFGVGRYFGDPSEFTPDNYTGTYDVLHPISTTLSDSTTAMGSWFASGGGDAAEANLYALHQAATDGADTAGPGTGSGESTGWRAGSQKVILWFGDVYGHQDTVTLADAITTLTGENVIVIGFNSYGANTGIDGSFDDGTGDARNQASAIASATGGSVVNNFSSVAIGDLVTVITTAIGAATSTIDLSLAVLSGDTSGLSIIFSCIDASGCDDVPGGESRDLRMSITGVTPGTYSFMVGAPGVSGAVEDDRIVVGEGRIPEPGTIAVFGIGLLAMGLYRRRRPN